MLTNPQPPAENPENGLYGSLFAQKAAKRGALYQATLPVQNSLMAAALWLDRKAERLTRQAQQTREKRDYALSLYQTARKDSGQ